MDIQTALYNYCCMGLSSFRKFLAFVIRLWLCLSFPLFCLWLLSAISVFEPLWLQVSRLVGQRYGSSRKINYLCVRIWWLNFYGIMLVIKIHLSQWEPSHVHVHAQRVIITLIVTSAFTLYVSSICTSREVLVRSHVAQSEYETRTQCIYHNQRCMST